MEGKVQDLWEKNLGIQMQRGGSGQDLISLSMRLSYASGLFWNNTHALCNMASIHLQQGICRVHVQIEAFWG